MLKREVCLSGESERECLKINCRELPQSPIIWQIEGPCVGILISDQINQFNYSTKQLRINT